MTSFGALLAQANPDGDIFVAQNIFFAVIAAAMLVAGIRVVTTDNVVHAALYLVVVLGGVAAQFILLGAEFVGVAQVLIYIGAVVVLFLFGIMLTRARLGADETVRKERRVLAALVGVVVFAVFAFALVEEWGDDHLDVAEPTRAGAVSDAIFSQYLVAFEVVSVLLLVVLIGAVVVARRD